MSEINKNLKKLYRIFKNTEFTFYDENLINNRFDNKNLFLKYNIKPIKKKSLTKGKIPSKNLSF